MNSPNTPPPGTVSRFLRKLRKDPSGDFGGATMGDSALTRSAGAVGRSQGEAQIDAITKVFELESHEDGLRSKKCR